MIVQISSGQGPAECELAVKKLYDALKDEFKDINLVRARKAKTAGCCTSIMFETDVDLSGLEGSVQWICKSPFRPHHGRKNWFVDVSVIPETDEPMPTDVMNNIRIEKFHSGGKGGQHVNKVETGVRVIHVPTGITVTSTKERSQWANKRDALQKLNVILKHIELDQKDRQNNNAWRKHTQLVRGNPVRVYEGMDFRLKEGYYAVY